MRQIGERALLGHILYRLKLLAHNTDICVATSDLRKGYVIEKYCRQSNTNCFHGDETNVLQRYYQCAEKYKMDHVVRFTGDNPFVDIEELNRLIKQHIKSNSDFSYTLSELPKGVVGEVFTYKSL